ncbi:helix-turn-helix domain-containing protein [Pseudonocardia xinjiangensis]|uniref:helix-turn-helix domain-containing protein n=1 Tax=Pseudonocardia xinjiangensis TaxID=75289 RepID=UPI003D93950B
MLRPQPDSTPIKCSGSDAQIGRPAGAGVGTRSVAEARARRTGPRHAQELLEMTDHGVETIARRTGFASATTFRTQFRRLAGVSPRTYRATFRARA